MKNNFASLCLCDIFANKKSITSPTTNKKDYEKYMIVFSPYYLLEYFIIFIIIENPYRITIYKYKHLKLLGNCYYYSRRLRSPINETDVTLHSSLVDTNN